MKSFKPKESMETIVALSTGEIHGAIALVRLSGPKALPVIKPLFRLRTGAELNTPTARHAYFGTIHDGQNILDEVILTHYAAPSSYTGEEMVEIATHGSPYIVQRLIELLIENGARPANPGEFTQRAFLAGKLDLTQAEAVGDLIAATNPLQHRVAYAQFKGGISKAIQELRTTLLQLATLIELEIDFGEEDVEFAERKELRHLTLKTLEEVGRLIDSYSQSDAIRHGVPITIAGPPNVGKSSLLNRLLEEERAIVTPYAGTTRDTIEGERTLRGVRYRFIDTAGIHKTQDPVESIGIERSHMQLAQAASVILMLDATLPVEQLTEQLVEMRQHVAPKVATLLLLSKSDLLNPEQRRAISNLLIPSAAEMGCQFWSVKSDEGFPELEAWLHEQAKRLLPAENSPIITNARHHKALLQAQHELHELLEALERKLSSDLLAFHVRAVSEHLGAITGEIGVEEILGNIFKNFCIGK